MPNADTVFNLAMSFVLPHEGGFTDDPNDRGGRTDMGITQREFDSWLRKQGLPPRDVSTITTALAYAIYREDYAKPSGFDSLVSGVPSLPKLAICVLDWAINHSPRAAVKDLQQCVGLSGAAADGIIGPNTLASIRMWCSNHSEAQLITAFDTARKNWYEQDVEKHSSQRRFLNGWNDRVNDLEVFFSKVTFA